MKEKIEEILGRHERDDVFGITQELLHLIQEERKDAVEGFVEYYLHSAIGRVGLYKALEEYLESEGKE